MDYLMLGRVIIACLFLYMSSSYGEEMQESTRKSIDYVTNLQVNCVFDHGYRCVETEEDDFLSPHSDQNMVPGPFLNAWQACYEDFKKIPDLTDEQKELKHYKIGITQNDSHFVVLFQGLLLPEIVDGRPAGTIRSVFGLST